MSDDPEPTERYDGLLTVRLLDDDAGRENIQCSSYREAIELVKDNRYSTTAVKIIDKDGDVVFDSLDMDIDDWETEWKHAKRQLSVEADDYDCPYDNVACFADDLCVQCKMDKVQNKHQNR
ncbi:hypothetical protein BV210_02555 [Halorientalis sp. IM1011]|uniref:hypothetical protein n=1 Tax=Halorientalis sp. IM1011 TaxID=1932360 RepID=UPI00097CCCEF|nr:hypothetical protein [Halorientalis sp. IM1011]AQL41662.1 hypothetical protein BV210_02555 [Halorientalis sp. IM1011]